MAGRFDYHLLDPDDPFELDDDNRPHLAKHSGYGEEDLYDAWVDDPLFYPAKPPADWLLVAELPGEGVVEIPLAAPRRGDHTECRPIGIYRASEVRARDYQRDRG